MSEIETQLKAGEKTLKDFTGQVRRWQEAVAEQDTVAVYETTGEKMQQKLKDMCGDAQARRISRERTRTRLAAASSPSSTSPC